MHLSSSSKSKYFAKVFIGKSYSYDEAKNGNYAALFKVLFIWIFQELIAQTREKQASTFSEFTWRGRKIPVNNEHIRAFLLMVRESEKEIEEASDIESKVSIHESLLQECIDALQIIREDLKNDPVSWKSYNMYDRFIMFN